MSTESSTPATKSPWVISNKVKTFGNIHEKALEELRNVGQEIERTDPGVSELLTILEKSEQVTQSLFIASKVRFLQRGYNLQRLFDAFKADGTDSRSWTNFFESEVRPIVQISVKSEELCRGVWNRWLAAAEHPDRDGLLHEGGNIHDFSKSLKRLADGDSAEPQPKAKPSAHDRIQKVRKQVGKQIAATTVGMDSDDDTYETLVKAVKSALAELEDYVASSRPSEAVVDTPSARRKKNPVQMGKPLQPPAGFKGEEVPFDGTDEIPEPFTKEGLEKRHPMTVAV